MMLLKTRYWLGIIALMVLVAVVGGYKLGSVPHGMTWDEAAIGYNGYAVITTRRDEWLVRLPISFQSFGDYKAPLAIYLNGFFTTVLGMKLWVVRLPFLLMAISSVIPLIGLFTHLLKEVETDEKKRQTFALIGGLAYVTSPWFLTFSRTGFESGISQALVIWGLYFLYIFLDEPVSKKMRSLFSHNVLPLLLGVLGIVGSMYSYHSAKVVAPGIILLLLALNFKKITKVKALYLVAALALSLLLLRPLIIDMFWGKGSQRFQQTTIFNKGLTTDSLVKESASQFADHLSPSFLISGETTSLRHGDGKWGVLLVTVFALVVFGAVATLSPKYRRIGVFSMLWIAGALLPAAVGVDSPHSNRSLLALPGLIILAVIGSHWLHQKVQDSMLVDKVAVIKSIFGTCLLLHAVLFVAYQRHYYTDYAAQSATEFNDGYLEAFQEVIPYEKGLNGKPQAEIIVFTTDYDQPYIYALFMRRTNPIWYQGGSLNTYLFINSLTESELVRKNAVIVGSAMDSLPVEKADKIIYGSDGSVRFKIYFTFDKN